MSGDVQPRKRKDKKKKKDDLGTEEPRGTAAALGEGDVFMHSYQDHGTGGHWCAKIIFFSLLAVLVTLIGLIILENRGLTELEANSVESRYSGVLEGWIEDAVDDHHDEHTLELKHHDDDEDHPDDQLYENESEESLEEEIDHNENDESNEDEGESNEIEDHSQNEDDDDGDEEDELENDDGDEEDELENDDGVEEDELENDEDGVDDDDEDEIQNYDDEERETHNDDDEGQNEDGDDEDDEKYDEEIEEKFKNEDDEEETYQHYIYEDISESYKNDDEDDEEQTHDFSKEITSHFKYHESYEDNDDESKENKYDDDIESNEHNTEDDASGEDKQGDDDDEDDEQAIEKIEREISDGDVSEEIADNASKEQKDASKESVKEELSKVDAEPPIEKISRPQAGKPFVEIEEETPLKPVDTLAEEEAYERQQEELRRQEEEAPHSLWLKLCVGGALLAATSALVRRATRPDAPEAEEPVMEETPSLSDRRMTIIDEPIRVTQTTLSRAPRQVVDEEVFKRPAPVIQSAPTAKPKIEEEIAKEVVAKVLELPKSDAKKEEDKELYSEEEKEEEEDEDEDVEEDNQLPETETSKKEAEESEPEADPEEVSDVEIIYDETVEEEEIPDEEIEEEEISDVDDTELLSRLEAKYGRLPEPERPGQYKGGGNSLEAEWPGEPSDPYWRSQLDTAEEEFRQGRWTEAGTRAGGGGLAGCGRARWLRASALHAAADHAHDDRLLAAAVAAYLHLLRMHDKLSDRQLRRVASRALDRIHFTGAYMRAEPVYRLLIRRFPDDVDYRNNLTISFLMANRADLADEVLRETLRLWPNDRVALAHHGFVLKTHHIKLEEAVEALRKALDGDAGRANEPRFYYHLGDALLLLGRLDEAHEVHRRGANLGHFLSASQRSLYNVPRLRARPWWRVEDTPYVELARALEESWRDILREGEAAVALYEQEREGLKDRGEWSQLDIFVRGREVEGRCRRAPALCAALRGAPCRRGQVKFSLMAPGTHVRPHVGPTNCRLRMHLALSNTEGTYIRVDKETRQWQLGKTLMFDDSFEHEVWHNGTGPRLVLIVDVWHPDLTAAERRQLPAI